jgi:hypothetical protein
LSSRKFTIKTFPRNFCGEESIILFFEGSRSGSIGIPKTKRIDSCVDKCRDTLRPLANVRGKTDTKNASKSGFDFKTKEVRNILCSSFSAGLNLKLDLNSRELFKFLVNRRIILKARFKTGSRA